MRDALFLENSSEWQLTLENEPLCLRGETVQIDFDSREHGDFAFSFALENNLPRKNVRRLESLQDTEVHPSPISLREGGSHIAVVHQQTPVGFRNVASCHSNKSGYGRVLSLVKLVHRIEEIERCRRAGRRGVTYRGGCHSRHDIQTRASIFQHSLTLSPVPLEYSPAMVGKQKLKY